MSTKLMREIIDQLYSLQTARNEAANRYMSVVDSHKYGYAHVSDEELRSAELAYYRAEKAYSDARDKLAGK